MDKDIWAKFEIKTLEDKKYGAVESVEEYTLSIFTTRYPNGLEYLLNYHSKIVSDYEFKLKSKFENRSHIFTFDSYNKEDNTLTWTANEFSSSRRMEHVWFEEKKTFLNAYKNFLYNKNEYDFRGDPYTFSILLYGPPGCGKTSLLKALINYDKKERQDNKKQISHLFVIPFSKIESIECFQKIMFNKKINDTDIAYDKRIYVFEDFDANTQSTVFNIRKGVHATEATNQVTSKNKGKSSNSIERQDSVTDNLLEKVAQIKENDENDGKTDGSGTSGGKDKAAKEKQDLLDEAKELDGGEAVLVQKEEDTKKAKAFDAIKSVFFDTDSEKAGKNKKTKLNLSDVLNVLDGLCERTGQRCVWTTNKAPPQKYFDPAFLRPGRMDMIIKLGCCTHDGIRYLLKQYYRVRDDDSGNLNSNGIISGVVEINLDGIDEKRFTPAQVKQICKESSNLKGAINMMRKICNNGCSNVGINNIIQSIIKENDEEKDETIDSLNIPAVKTTTTTEKTKASAATKDDDKLKDLGNLGLDNIGIVKGLGLSRSVSEPPKPRGNVFGRTSSGPTVQSHAGHWFEPNATPIANEPIVVGDEADDDTTVRTNSSILGK